MLKLKNSSLVRITLPQIKIIKSGENVCLIVNC